MTARDQLIEVIEKQMSRLYLVSSAPSYRRDSETGELRPAGLRWASDDAKATFEMLRDHLAMLVAERAREAAGRSFLDMGQTYDSE
jgi:hypothetical protein|tara:strand:+ start:4028 stop:4285 length:258 start_codon:yes stop_codon:yes gene_type:complete